MKRRDAIEPEEEPVTQYMAPFTGILSEEEDHTPTGSCDDKQSPAGKTAVGYQ